VGIHLACPSTGVRRQLFSMAEKCREEGAERERKLYCYILSLSLSCTVYVYSTYTVYIPAALGW